MCVRNVALCGVALVLGFVAGCGPAASPRAEVSGKISYGGKPLTAGTVSFVSGDIVASGAISNGQYKILDAPVGDVKIGIVTPPANAGAQQMKQKVPGKSFEGPVDVIVPVPPNYFDPTTSGLTYTVTKESPQSHDIEIK